MPTLRVPAVPSHLAPILVSVPWWTRLNRYAEQPGSHPFKLLAEDILRSRHVSDYVSLPIELHRRRMAA
jgi:hypothetical protein